MKSYKATKLEPLFQRMDRMSSMSYQESKRTFTPFQRSKMNYFAAIFTFIYYMYHGMWRKAITLTAIVLIADVVIFYFYPSLSVAPNALGVVTFGLKANGDLYDHYRKGKDGWF